MFKAIFFTGLLAIAVAQNVPAPTCYGGGVGPATDCNQFISDFCSDVAKNRYRVGDSGSNCYNLPNGNRCDFIAFNSRNVAAAPSGVNCNTVLKNAARRCNSGGYGRIGQNAYTFVVDPNRGRCAAGVQGGS